MTTNSNPTLVKNKKTPPLRAAITPQEQEKQLGSRLSKLTEISTSRFKNILKKQALLSLAFLGILLAEFLFFLGAIFISLNSIFTVCLLAALFLTCFSFFIFHIYLQSSKNEQIIELSELFLKTSKHIIGYQDGALKSQLFLTDILIKFVKQLQKHENFPHDLPQFLKKLEFTISVLSFYFYWKDFLKIKELLFSAIVEEHIKRIKSSPTNLEAHMALANAYILRSNLYRELIEKNTEAKLFYFSEYTLLELREKMEKFVKSALEELKILNTYAPNELWVHYQLAYGYHDLQMLPEEIEQYEAIVSISPDDSDCWFKLGLLYFKQGNIAEGLKIYEKLKRVDVKKGEALLEFYGTSTGEE